MDIGMAHPPQPYLFDVAEISVPTRQHARNGAPT
jgi:hypothetical protein